MASAIGWLLLCSLFLVSVPAGSADWTLVLAHSNDFWFQLDEVKADDSICYRPIPDPTTTPAPTTLPTTPSTTPSTTTPSTTTPSTTTPSTTTPSPPPSATTPSATTPSTNTPSPTSPSSQSSPSGILATDKGRPEDFRFVRSESSVVPNVRLSVKDPTAPYYADKITTIIPHFADKVMTTVPHFVDKITTIPHFADKFTTIPHFADKVTTIPHFADKVTTPTTKPTSDKPYDDRCYGGVARHLTASNRLRQKAMEEKKAFIHLNAGGMLGGNIWFPILGSDPAAESVKSLNYSAVGLGYRDFDEGVETAERYLRKLKDSGVKVVCANADVTDEPSLKDVFVKSVTVDIDNGPSKVGIIGFLGTDAEYLADIGKIKFTDEKAAINAEVTKLLDSGVTFIIAVGNVKYEKAKELLGELFNVDIIVNGGGKSTFLFNGEKGPLGEIPSDKYPVVVDNQGTKRYLVETTRYGKYIGKLEVQINNDGRVIGVAADSNPILLGDNYVPEPNLQYQVDQWEREVLKQSEERIGYTKIPIISNRTICWYEECSGANLMTDAARWYLENNVTVDEPWKDSIAATVWHGGALSDTSLGVAPGPIKFGDILYMFPYANTLAIATMTGAQVKELMEKSVFSYKDPNAPKQGEFLHVSGMKVDFNLTQAPGSRVSKILIRNTSNPKGGYALINPTLSYKIGMPSFIAKGGSVYEFMDNIPHKETGIRDEFALKAFIKWVSPLTYGNEGRLNFVDGDVSPTTGPTVSPTGSPDPEPCPSSNVTGTVFLTIFLTLLFTGLIFVAWKFLYPKIRDRRGSLMSLVR